MKCAKCKKPATWKVLWAEGRAYQPACDDHKEAVAETFRHKTNPYTGDKDYDDFSGFRKMATLLAFMDEMEKISGVLQDVGQKIKNTVRAPGRTIGGAVVGAGRDAYEAARGLKNHTVNWMASGGPRREVRGAVRAFQENPVTSVRKGMGQEMSQFMGSSRLHKGLHVAGTAMNLASLAQREDPTGAGRSRLARGLEFAGGEVGRYAGMPYSTLGAHLTSSLGRKAGRLAGSAIDKVRNKGKESSDEMSPHPLSELPQKVERND